MLERKIGRYYDMAQIIDSMKKDGEIFSYGLLESDKVFYAEDDDNKFVYVITIFKDLNSKFEIEEGAYLLERNYIYLCDLEEAYGIEKDSEKFIKNVLKFYSIQGFAYWDSVEFDSMEKALSWLENH